MVSFDRIPSYVFDILTEKGADVDNIYIATYCDMDSEHNFCDTYIVATNEYVDTKSSQKKKTSALKKILGIAFVIATGVFLYKKWDVCLVKRKNILYNIQRMINFSQEIATYEKL